MNVLTRSLRLVGLLLAELAAVTALHRLGARPPFVIPLHDVSGWLHTAAPADVLMALLRVAALGGASWLLATTVAYAIACACRVPGAVHLTGALTLPFARRLVDAALAASIAAGSLLAPTVAAGPAGAATSATTSSPGATGVRDGHVHGALASLPAETSPTTTPTTAPTTTPTTAPTTTPTTAPTSMRATEASSVAPSVVIVQPGDSLWQLAAARIAEQTGRTRSDLTETEITRYWLTLCDTNRPHLQSGDPSLIYPGEAVTLPPVS